MPAMTKTATKKQRTPPEAERKERLLLEAKALRRVFNLPLDERAAAAEALRPWELVLLVQDVARAMQTSPGMELADVGAMLARPALRDTAADLKDAEADRVLDPAQGQDPEDLAAAYAQVMADTAKAADLQRMKEADKLLGRARTAKDTTERRTALADAIHSLEAAERAEVLTLAEAWNAYRGDRFNKSEAGPKDAILLDVRRGKWADWCNRNMGPRGGLEPGRMVLVGGGPAGGKTTLGALLAVDAMAAGVPVLFWQLELSREETLEHLLSQVGAPYAKTSWRTKANRELPAEWRGLLTLPKCNTPEAAHVENIIRAMEAQARKARRTAAHAVRGLVVVDYAQLLTVADRTARDSRFEVLEKAASRLAKAAGECGAVLVLLSQVNKGARKEAEAVAGTSYAGADLERMAHVALTLWKAKGGKPAAANEKADRDPDHGEARIMTFTKRRGCLFKNDGLPEEALVLWYSTHGRAFHGGETPKQTSWE